MVTQSAAENFGMLDDPGRWGKSRVVSVVQGGQRGYEIWLLLTLSKILMQYGALVKRS